jgi:DNA-binding MarR family transcriptional regulator
MSEPRWLDSTEMSAWTGFLETFNLLQRRIEAHLRADGGITHVQYEILHRLAEATDRRLRMTDLAHQLIASRSGLTYQVAQLNRTGLVRRDGDPGDERAVLVAITDAGMDVLRNTAPGHLRVVRENLLDLLDPDEVRQLAAMMGRARTHLRSTRPRA